MCVHLKAFSKHHGWFDRFGQLLVLNFVLRWAVGFSQVRVCVCLLCGMGCPCHSFVCVGSKLMHEWCVYVWLLCAVEQASARMVAVCYGVVGSLVCE